MANLEHRSTNDLGGTGAPAVTTAGDDLLVDLREDAFLAEDRAVIDLRGRVPLVTFEPAPDATVHRRWLLLVMLAILNVLDLVTTRLVLDAGGTEGNPLMAPIIHHPVAPILVKTAGIAMVACLLRACPPKSRLVDAGLMGVTFGYTIVVCWNMLNLAAV